MGENAQIEMVELEALTTDDFLDIATIDDLNECLRRQDDIKEDQACSFVPSPLARMNNEDELLVVDFESLVKNEDINALRRENALLRCQLTELRKLLSDKNVLTKSRRSEDSETNKGCR
jgi:hypothetical protein